MATLTEDDIEKLFSGAPHFRARNESHFAGAPQPSVAFPFDEELEISDLSDHVPIEANAWGSVTAWSHLTRDVNGDPAARRRAAELRKSHFHVKCRERPNMLSMQGLERGTMGFQAALELPVGDSLNEEQFGFGGVGTKAKAIVEARDRMLSRTGWLHRVPEHVVLDRLMRNSELYRHNDLKSKPTYDSYHDLFGSLMRPGKAILVDKNDQHSLANQINYLLKCLGTANVWIDLSHVEWRIRLGQILWGRADGDEVDDATDISDAHSSGERAEEKYWLLLQILIASELLIRLDAVTEGQEFGPGAFRQIDVVHFERAATPAVKWSLFLAQSWLENIEIVRDQRSDPETEALALKLPARPPRPAGKSWLSSLASKVLLFRHEEHQSHPPSPHHYTIKGRYSDRQVDGLTHFARKLRWPGIDTYESRIAANAENAMLKPTTPMPSGTPRDPSGKSSYFGAWDVTGNKGKQNDGVQVQRRKMAAALHPRGWLSKSYVFGLLLPGEALGHFLMATLLENDGQAMDKLGSFANLCGGFVYAGMSFWSTSCIVGRVLAAGDGAAECMGWVSTNIIPEGTADGWVNICADDVAEDMQQLGKKARIWAKKRLERESSILGDGDEDSVLPADFIVPHEANYTRPPPLVNVELRAFKLLASTGSVQPTPLAEMTSVPTVDKDSVPVLTSHPAAVVFSVSLGGQTEEHCFSLAYDVNFVTAHPCAPSSRVRFLKSPSSPTIQQIDVSGSDILGNTSRSVHRAGHPLHKSFNYSVVHISELLQRRHYFLSDFLTTPVTPSVKPSSRTNNNRVLVIDCITNLSDVPPSPSVASPVMERFPPRDFRPQQPPQQRQSGSDMEILVRALCSQNGWNAIISRRKRGCLACAIREAGALGWKVIVRVP